MPKTGVPSDVKAWNIKFNSVTIEDKTQRRTFLQSLASSISKHGYDVSLGPIDSESIDLVLLGVERDEAEKALHWYSNLQPKVSPGEQPSQLILQSAWQNKIRSYLLKRGFMKIGQHYIAETEILDQSKKFKNSFRIEGEVTEDRAAVWIDYKTKVMTPLSNDDIKKASILGDNSDIYVRVLPRWNFGILVGKNGKLAIDEEFPLHGRVHKTPDYWKIKHDVKFVKPSDEMLSITVPSFQRTLPYPRSCVFKEYGERTLLPHELKKYPQERVTLTNNFMHNVMKGLDFLGTIIEFEGPLSSDDMRYSTLSYDPTNRFHVTVGKKHVTNVDGLLDSLKLAGPYAGEVNGKYVVIHSGHKEAIKNAMDYISSVYEKMNFGKLRIAIEIGDGGFIDAHGEKTADYTSAITALRTKLQPTERLLVFVVIPSVYSADIYYKTRGYLFQRVFGMEALPCQAMGYETIQKIVNNDRVKNPIAVNTCSQLYVKLGGTGSAVWILNEPADGKIPSIVPGTSCYAYYDVSRRIQLKSSATAYSAMTDSYGRYIATGNKPAGGEKLAPSNFYDILFDLIQKISLFSNRFSSVNGIKFGFERLVFAKDGLLRRDEANMMESVILNGIPEENKEPIGELLKRVEGFPKKLVIDIIGVNKSPNKRIFEYDGRYSNVKGGTGLVYNDKKGLLVSTTSQFGTSQPLEISLLKHITINTEGIQVPHISQIMEEYYKLTKLNWSSVFKQGKLALPQILTQNLGENLSYGITVPDNMVLL